MARILALEEILPMLKRVEEEEAFKPFTQLKPLDLDTAQITVYGYQDPETAKFLQEDLHDALVDFIFSSQDGIYINEDNAKALARAGYPITTQRIEVGSFEEEVTIQLSNCVLEFTW